MGLKGDCLDFTGLSGNFSSPLSSAIEGSLDCINLTEGD